MNWIEILLILALAAAVYFSLRSVFMHKKNGACGSCDGCPGCHNKNQ